MGIERADPAEHRPELITPQVIRYFWIPPGQAARRDRCCWPRQPSSFDALLRQRDRPGIIYINQLVSWSATTGCAPTWAEAAA